MAGPQPSADEAVDDVDSKALVGIGRKFKREQQETVPDADDPRPLERAEDDRVDAPENNTTITTAKYTVGWVCALPLEMAAARGMLDEVHPNLPEQDAADHNSYVLGQVQGHDVVIACLPAGVYGITSAATVAKDLLRTFKSIRFGLMVGIGGGAPSKTHDIRLGDVVVSQPTNTSGGVIQYDRGKTVQEGELQRTGSLNAPPQVLLAALSRLQADYRIVGSRIPQFLQELITKSPKRMKKKFGYQGASNDYLFHAGYHHVNLDSTCEHCEHCDQSQTVERDARDDTDPVVHYGNIASGNQVIKDATTRDRLSSELGVLCFEMEAAGLQDFPCLVTRGICDYADSHKNKDWQEYAAAAAAAFAKELLSVIPPTRVLQDKPIRHLVSDPQLLELVSNTNTAITAQTQEQEARCENQLHLDCHRAFKTSTYEQFKNINRERVPGTCKWVVDHPRYIEWKQSRHDALLWISADPGCGKSVLAKSLIDEELQHTNEHTVCYFFFKDNNEQNSLSTALCAFLHQLFRQQPLLLRHAIFAYMKNGQDIQKEVAELWRIFLSAATDNQAVNITCVIDALDECCVEDRKTLISFLTDFHNQRITFTRKSQLKFLVTSRPYQDIESEFNDIPEPQSIRLAGEDSNANISDEINLVIQNRVAKAGRKHGMSQDVQNALQEKLSTVPHRTYLWLHLVMDEVNHNPKRHKKAFIKELDSLPTTVQDAYEKILGRLNHNRRQRQDTETLLHIVVGAHRPLTVSEMDVAFQLATDAANAQAHEDLDLSYGLLESQIRELCGLFVFINDSRIYLIHQTAKEFLVTKNSLAYPTDNLWKNSLHEIRSDAVIGKVCVQYLCFNDIGEDACIDTSTYGHIRTVINTTQYPFLDYFIRHWPIHSRKAMSANEDLQEWVMRLYDRRNHRVGLWLPAIWKSGPGYRARDTLNTLHLASFHGHHEVLQRQIAIKHADLDSRDGQDATPLIWGCRAGHEEIVQMLLDNGADINAQSSKAGNALYAASNWGHDMIVQMLLNKGADADARRGIYSAPLLTASFHGHVKVVQKLINNGADVNVHEPDTTALEAASSMGHDKIVQMLLDKGADPNFQEGFYGSALKAATFQGHDKIVQILINNGANVNGQKPGDEPVLQLISITGDAKIARILLDSGAVDSPSGGALKEAQAMGRTDIVQMLLDKR